MKPPDPWNQSHKSDSSILELNQLLLTSNPVSGAGPVSKNVSEDGV